MRVLVALIMLVLGANAAAQELPETVTTPYLAYEAAMQAGDAAAAMTAADQAWRAAVREQVDLQTATVLAGNLARIATRQRQNELALEAFEAELNGLEATQASALEIASVHRRISDTRIQMGDMQAAIRAGLSSLELLDTLEETQPVAAERALAHLNLSISRWNRHRYRTAGRDGELAMLAARRAGLAEVSVFAIGAFHAGAHHFYNDRFDQSAYWFAVAHYMLVQNDEMTQLSRAALLWGRHARSKLDSDERQAILDRLGEEALISEVDSLRTVRESRQGDFVEAVPVQRRPPTYPRNASWAGAEGFALMQFDVDVDGRVIDPEVVFSLPYRDFGEAALRAVRRWRYEPATQDGVAVVQDGVVVLLQFELAN